jgi:hypothetical protein
MLAAVSSVVVSIVSQMVHISKWIWNTVITPIGSAVINTVSYVAKIVFEAGRAVSNGIYENGKTAIVLTIDAGRSALNSIYNPTASIFQSVAV